MDLERIGDFVAAAHVKWASEMVVKALKADLRVAEIPIEYRPRVGDSKPELAAT